LLFAAKKIEKSSFYIKNIAQIRIGTPVLTYEEPPLQAKMKKQERM
jgi:hypothetical protein